MGRNLTDFPAVPSRQSSRLHLNHGPIDLVIKAFGNTDQVNKALQQAERRFKTILDELVTELPLLRNAVFDTSPVPKGNIAKAMHRATLPYLPKFITPMAAVAGAVADAVLAAMLLDTSIQKAFVNNGGDIALHLGHNTDFRIGIVADPREGSILTRAAITANCPIRGIATSGRHGRSLSLGIADSVTVFAKTAAIADAAATIIANAVDLPNHPAIVRQPACELSPDSDLGDHPVTISVPGLSGSDISTALAKGEKTAGNLCANGTIEAAFLTLQGSERVISWPERQTPAKFPFHKSQPDRIAHA